jgi:hypothetical protein
MGDMKNTGGTLKEDTYHSPSLKLSSGIIITCPNIIELFSMSSRNLPISEETIQIINSIGKSLLNGTDSNGWRKIPSKQNYTNNNTNTFRSKNFTPHSSKINNQSKQSQKYFPRQTYQSTDYRPAPQKYISRFQNSEKNMDSHILNTIILGKLNKFSPQNYNEIKEFLEQILGSGQTDFLKDFMKLVFEKAATEQIFCALYARLLGELSENYAILITEMEFLYNKFIHIFSEISDSENSKTYDDFLDANSEKTYRLGYSQFLTELLPYSVVKPEFLIKVIQAILENSLKIVRQPNNIKLMEEYTDCLVRILKSIIGTKNNELIGMLSVEENNIINNIKLLSVKNVDFKSQSAKSRFSCLDIVEMLNV